MEISNVTGYRLRDIRKLILAAFKAEGVSPADYDITVARTNRTRIHGRAGIGYHYIHMRIPETWDKDLSQEEIHIFAKVLVHEIGHTLGLVHKEQVPVREIPTPWADGLAIRRKPERIQIPVRERRYATARRKLVEHSRKLKREQNMVRKWRSKVRYYERTLAAGGGAA